MNNLRNGNGKEFNFDGKIIFKEEYKDGNWWTGKVYEYKDNNIYEINNGKGYLKYMAYWGSKNFEGEYLNGKKNGKGKEYDNHILIFEGEYLNGKKNGKGKEYNCDNTIIFEGDYFNDKKWNGKGYDKNNNTIYEINNGKGYLKEFDTYNRLLF